MITILAIIAILIAGFWIFKDLWWDEQIGNRSSTTFFTSLGLTAIISVMIGMLGAMLFALVIMTPWASAHEIQRQNHSRDIYSLKQNQEISGSFFLGSGGFGSSEQYYMFAKDERGGLERLAVNSWNCYIFQDQDERPQLKWQDITYEYPRWLTLFSVSYESRTSYDIHVPANTVIQQFKVD